MSNLLIGFIFYLYSASERKSYQTDKKLLAAFLPEKPSRDHTDRSFDFKDIFQFLFTGQCVGSSDFRPLCFSLCLWCCVCLCAAHRRSDRISRADSGIWGLYRLGQGSISDADYFSHGCPAAVQCGIFHPPADRGKI